MSSLLLVAMLACSPSGKTPPEAPAEEPPPADEEAEGVTMTRGEDAEEPRGATMTRGEDAEQPQGATMTRPEAEAEAKGATMTRGAAGETVRAAADRAWQGRLPGWLDLPPASQREVPATWYGSLGAADEVALALAVDDSPGSLHALARAPSFQDILRLEPPHALDRLDEVLVADLDGDGGLEAVVLASLVTGIGPQGAVPYGQALVLDVVPADEASETGEGDGLRGTGDHRLVQRPELQRRIAEASTRAEVIEALDLDPAAVSPQPE